MERSDLLVSGGGIYKYQGSVSGLSGLELVGFGPTGFGVGIRAKTMSKNYLSSVVSFLNRLPVVQLGKDITAVWRTDLD